MKLGTLCSFHHPCMHAGKPALGSALTAPLQHFLMRCCRLSLTFFGLVPKGCSSSECGDYKEQATMAGGSGNITALVSYPRPGRYIVRLQVSPGGSYLGSAMPGDQPPMLPPR